MRITAGIDYRDEDDSQSGKTKGIQLKSNLQYIYRQLRIETGLEYNVIERSSNKTKNTFLYFRLKRFF